MKKDTVDKIIILETYNHVIKHLDTLLEDDSSNELRGPYSTELAELRQKYIKLSAEYKTKRNSVVFSYDDPKRIVQLKGLINWLEGVIQNLEWEKPPNGDDQIMREYDFQISVFENHLVEAKREYTKTLDIQYPSTTSTTTPTTTSTTTPEPRSWIQNLGSNLKDFITNRTTIISLGVVVFSLIAYYFWKRYRRDRCEGLTGKVLKNCKLQAINQAILGVRSQIKNCKTQSDPKKCVQDAKKVMKEWEAKKRMI